MRRFLLDILLLAAVAVGIFLFRAPLWKVAAQLEQIALPCRQPITYSIGTLDPRFGLSKSGFVASIEKAEGLWEKASGKNLFQYQSTGGVLSVNLVFDSRQATTDKLHTLGTKIDTSQASYDEFKTQYDALLAKYTADKNNYEEALASYERDQASYNQEVQYWNARGGAPRAQYNQLQAEKSSLQSESVAIQSQQDSLNAETKQFNQLVDELNNSANAFNNTVSTYNTVGSSAGAEFEEGLYQSSTGNQEIDVYEFSSQARLVRVLAHELGHALGMNHVSDPQAIMYYLNQSSNEVVTDADLTELDRVCSSGVRL